MALSTGALLGIDDPAVAIVIVLSAFATLPLAVFGLLAYRRRRTTSYLFVALAFLLFLLKSVLGGISVAVSVDVVVHHLLEHGFDFAIAMLLLGAIYSSRSQDRLDVFSADESNERD